MHLRFEILILFLIRGNMEQKIKTCKQYKVGKLKCSVYSTIVQISGLPVESHTPSKYIINIRLFTIFNKNDSTILLYRYH